MKLRKSILIATALAVPATLHANTFFFSGTEFGAWNPDNAANWNGNPPGFGNTADIVFDGDILDTYGTWLGNGDRTVRSLTFSNIDTQLEVRTNNNATIARQLRYAAASGNATITVDSTVSAPIIIGAQAGANDNGSQRLDSNLNIVHNGSALLTMRRPINQSGGTWGITKSGSGTLLLAGDSSYGGPVNIIGGTLRINNANSLGARPKDVTVSSGATLEVAGNISPGEGYNVTVSGSGNGGIGAIHRLSGNDFFATTFADGINLAGPTTIGAAPEVRFGVGGTTGTTTGLHTLTKIGAGQFDLRGSITIGDVVVEGGVFQTQNSDWNDDGHTISLSPGTDFRLFEIGNPFPRDILLDNASITSTGSADLIGDTITGDVTLTGNCSISSSGDPVDSLILTGDLTESAPGASVTIGGTRKVVLAGNNTYTGPTSITTGAGLDVAGSLTSDISVPFLTTIGGDGSTTGSITFDHLSNLAFDPSTTGPGEFLSAASILFVDPSDSVTLVPDNPGTGVPAVILRNEAGPLNLANFSLPDPGRATLALGGSPANSELIYNPNAADLEWRNFSADGLWGIEDSANNFQNLGTASPDDFFINDNVSFTNAATGLVTLDNSITVGNVVFNNTTGSDIEIAPNFLSDTITAASLTLASSGDVTISAPIVGATPVTVDGGGTLTLTGINTTLAPLSINSGTVRLGNGGSIGSVASEIVNDSSLVIDRSDTLTLNKLISGTGTLTLAGTGTTILGTTHTYSGLTTISSGTLEIPANGSIPGSILNNSSLVLSGTADKTFANDISGTGSLTKRGSHVLTLTGSNNFTGGVIFEVGDLNAGSANIGSGEVTFVGNGNIARWFIPDGSVIANDIFFADGANNNKVIGVATLTSHAELTGTITFADDSTTNGKARIAPVGGTIVISGKMTGDGTGGYAKRNNGTVVITGTDNDYTGPTTIVDAGTLLVNGSIQSDVFFGENHDGSSTSAVNGTLGGSGLINANVTTRSASNLSPGGASNAGVNTDTAATLTIGGNLDFSLSAAGVGLIRMDLDAPAGTNDRINVGGQAIIGNGALGLSDFAFNNLGGLAAGTYTLISTTGGVSGTLNPSALSGEIAPGLNGTLDISGNDIVLIVSAGTGNAFDTWAAANGLDGSPGKEDGFDDDPDGDGIANGLEWILGGKPLDGMSGNLVTATATAAGGLTLGFTRNQDAIGLATLTVEYGTTLASWPGSAVVGPVSSGPDANGVVVTVNEAPTPDEVTVNIPASNSAPGKLFARLKATLN